MDQQPEIRALASDDLDWVIDLTRARRARLEPHAPTFWRPAPDADARHRAFLASLIADPSVLGIRTAHGYPIGLDRAGSLLVDDAALVDDSRWATDGVALLSYAATHCRVRCVVPAFETQRLAAARAVGLAPVETWWHRDVEPTGPVDDEDAVVAVDGALGRLVRAPAVYDPGGPVLLVASVGSPAALARIEEAATARGATVSVVSQRLDDGDLAAMLRVAGHVTTTYFCEPPA